MAKAATTERGGKSNAVRDYFKKNPGARVGEAVEGLKAQGVDVSTALVSKIKYRKKVARLCQKTGLPL